MKEKHKILFFVDTHGSKNSLKSVIDKAKNVDLIVCLGDLTFFGEHLTKFARKLNSIKKPVLMIAGNHEYPEEIDELCKKYKNLIYFDDKFYEYNNLIFYGNSEGGFSLHDLNLDKKIHKIKKRFDNFKKKHKNAKTIICFHSPPYNTALDVVSFKHVGSKTKSKLIKIVKPNTVVSGHIHDTKYKKETKWETFMLNPGPEGRIIKFDKENFKNN